MGQAEKGIKGAGVGIRHNLSRVAGGRDHVALGQGDLHIASGGARTSRRGKVVVTGQLKGLLEHVKRPRAVTLGLLEACQRALAADQDFQVAGALAQLEPLPQVIGCKVQVVPLVEEGAQLVVGQGNGWEPLP